MVDHQEMGIEPLVAKINKNKTQNNDALKLDFTKKGLNIELYNNLKTMFSRCFQAKSMVFDLNHKVVRCFEADLTSFQGLVLWTLGPGSLHEAFLGADSLNFTAMVRIKQYKHHIIYYCYRHRHIVTNGTLLWNFTQCYELSWTIRIRKHHIYTLSVVDIPCSHI